VKERLALEHALLDLTQAKLDLTSGNFAEAAESLREANSYFRSFKLRLALAGLQVAPRFTRLGAQAWNRLQVAFWRLRLSARLDWK
jgi:hypothetical protein